MNAGLIALIVILALMGIIVLAVILLKRHVGVFKSDEKPKSDKEIAKEELDRILEPFEGDASQPKEETPSEEEPSSDGAEATEEPSEGSAPKDEEEGQ